MPFHIRNDLVSVFIINQVYEDGLQRQSHVPSELGGLLTEPTELVVQPLDGLAEANIRRVIQVGLDDFAEVFSDVDTAMGDQVIKPGPRLGREPCRGRDGLLLGHVGSSAGTPRASHTTL